jgi:hypothetical protein
MTLKFIRLVLRVGAVATLHSTGFAADSDIDHLQPVVLTEFPKYRQVLKSKLCVSPADCGRALTRQSFAPEESVSVYRVRGNNAWRYQVTYTVAEDNLWQKTDAGRKLPKAKSVGVRRIDAAISDRIAATLRNVWIRMLSGSQRPRPTPAPTQILAPTEGSIDEFCVERGSGSQLCGELDVSIPPPGTKTKKFVGLSGLLVEYCKAKTNERSAISSRIETEAKSLLSDLERSK